MRKVYLIITFTALLAVFIGCSKKSDYNKNTDVIKEWRFVISSSGENTIATGKEVSAVFHMIALADSSLTYDIQANDSTGDNITSAKLHLGDPLTDGAILINLPVRIYSNYASGVLSNIRPGLMDTLLNDNLDKYINATSVKAPAGLMRGPLNSTIVLSRNVQLTGDALVPAVATNAKGIAFIRLMNNHTLYSKIVVTNDPADSVATATINSGTNTTNGPVLLNLASSAADFGIAKKASINASVYAVLSANSTYVIAGSANNPSGKIRGQIK